MKSRKPRKDGRYSINLSFTPEEVNLIDYVDSKGNFSSYVKRLIKQDMEKEKINNPFHGISPEIIQIIKETIKQVEQPQKVEQQQNDDEVQKPKKKGNKKAIMDILNK